MDIYTVAFEILPIPYAMVGEPAFPDFHRGAQSFSDGMRVAAFDELHRTLQGDSLQRQEQMKMLGHEHKRVKSELSLPPI